MNIGLIGARRTSNGIGEYIGKYFHTHGARISAILGTSEKSAGLAVANLSKYGINARPYSDFSRMMGEQNLDAVVIASPTHTHEHYIKQCLDAGVHIFCEKPFICPDRGDMDTVLHDIFSRADRRGVTIAMNSQWVFSLKFYKKLCGSIPVSGPGTFFMRLSPVCSGREMIPDSVPHALSILYAVLGEGAVDDLHCEGVHEEMHIAFTYAAAGAKCSSHIMLKTEKSQPRTFSFGFDSKTVTRHIEMDTYRIGLSSGESCIMIPDPLGLSVKDFIESVDGKKPPVVGRKHIIVTSNLLKRIYDGCAIR